MQLTCAYTSYTFCYNMIMIISNYVTNHFNSSCNMGYNEQSHGVAYLNNKVSSVTYPKLCYIWRMARGLIANKHIIVVV